MTNPKAGAGGHRVGVGDLDDDLRFRVPIGLADGVGCDVSVEADYDTHQEKVSARARAYWWADEVARALRWWDTRQGLPIVCLCGSTRFAAEINSLAVAETLAGRIVVRPEVVTYDGSTDPQHVDPEQKTRLDELHKRKIDLADEILVLNVGGYIGESTRSELEYARAHGKLVRWLKPSAFALPGELYE